MDREGHEDVKFFIGTEVEKFTCVWAKDFVCSWILPKEEILARALNSGCPTFI